MAGGGPSKPQINVTPLIDVLLTLIIVFMLVVSSEQEKGEKAQIPQPNPNPNTTAPVPELRTVVIEVVWTAKDQPPVLKINQQEVKREDLETQVAEIFLKRAEKVVFVRGDDDVDFEYVADVIDVAHHAGVQRVGLLTKDREVVGE